MIDGVTRAEGQPAERVEQTVKSGARAGKRGAKRTAGNPVVVFGFRAGYVMRGLLYAAMGLGALSLAAGRSSHGSDQKGALALVTGRREAVAILVLVAVALAAYSAWGFVRAILDPLRRGDDAGGIVERLGFAWSGLSYAALLIVVIQILIGGRPDLHSDSVQSLVAVALRTPLGRAGTATAGLIGIAAGVGQFVEAYRAGFKRDLKRGEMEAEVFETAVFLGRFGMASRGVIFLTTGWCVLAAAYTDNGHLARGFGAAFDQLLSGPWGHVLVAVLGIGFIALALHSAASARWLRIPKSYA